MRMSLPRGCYAYPMLLSLVVAGFAGAASAQDLPSYMAPIAGRTSSDAAAIATRNVLALNARMFDLYENSGKLFRQN